MSSVATSESISDWEIEKRCVNLAFAVGGPLFLYGLIVSNPAHLVSGAILYTGSLIASAIRDTADKR